SRPKPDPDPFLIACDLLQARPDHSWVIEDSPTGATAGLAAGCWVLGVGPALDGLRDPRLHLVPSLAGVTLSSLGGDGVQDS
ncbi:HAD-IA family hydrolase, partial [Klebsiella pneumoniae]|uniref:HAD-IA family hydrolase n=1 Tax=Klebsiella pneumoniae TaxID=573 RepID=UPI001C5EC315